MGSLHVLKQIFQTAFDDCDEQKDDDERREAFGPGSGARVS